MKGRKEEKKKKESKIEVDVFTFSLFDVHALLREYHKENMFPNPAYKMQMEKLH